MRHNEPPTFGGCTAVLDVGKTNAKLSLWSNDGRLMTERTRANGPAAGPGYDALDVAGIEPWLASSLRELAQLGDVRAIIPVAHGAAVAMIEDGKLVMPPLSYEQAMPAELDKAYRAHRDAFEATGSPRLPNGLNLGAQLLWMERLAPRVWPGRATLVTFPQYWSWLLSGVAATEVTTLGCHSDLWRPFERRPSDLARHRGWADRFAPLRKASDVLGPITADWSRRTGLPAGCAVLCGLHDSNAALLSARAHAELAGRDLTVLSTGTWFVAMRTPSARTTTDIARLPEERDCLINVDVDGHPTPSARFMGGREFERAIGDALDDGGIVTPSDLDQVLTEETMLLPSLVPGSGPFPHAPGRWLNHEPTGAARRAAVAMYLALVTDASLSLIDAKDALLVEGRFAEDAVFLGMLASLRPSCRVYASPTGAGGVAFGALRLLHPDLKPGTGLVEVAPLRQNIQAYAERWRSNISLARKET